MVSSRGWRGELAGKGQEGTFQSDGNFYPDTSLSQCPQNGTLKVCTYTNFTSKGINIKQGLRTGH